MSRKNTVKIVTKISESSGYHFKSTEDDSSYVIASKHGLCHLSKDCKEYNEGQIDCCKSCNVELSISNVTLCTQRNLLLTPLKIYSFPNNDIAIIKVLEKSFTPLKLGKLEEYTGSFIAHGYKAGKKDSSRLILNSPELDNNQCYFNIESNSTSELIEKSQNYYGISGSLVIGQSSTDIPIAYSILTTNEEENDLFGDVLYDIDYEPLHLFFGSKIFSKKQSNIPFDIKFKEYFKELDIVKVNENLAITVLIPADKGFPYFNLNPIANALTNELGFILGHEDKSINNTVLTSSALQVLKKHKNKQPVYKLLSSRIVESVMSAPHIYSTYIDHSHYHHIHLLNKSDSGFEFIISNFGGEGDLSEKFNKALQEMVKNINKYSFNSKLISKRAFLEMRYNHEECELLYEVLFNEHDDIIRNLAIIHCMDLQCIGYSKGELIEEHIKQLVHNAASSIDRELLDLVKQGLNVNLYVLPTNKSNELAELMEEILG